MILQGSLCSAFLSGTLSCGHSLPSFPQTVSSVSTTKMVHQALSQFPLPTLGPYSLKIVSWGDHKLTVFVSHLLGIVVLH